jgi:hypothetical protein
MHHRLAVAARMLAPRLFDQAQAMIVENAADDRHTENLQ